MTEENEVSRKYVAPDGSPIIGTLERLIGRAEICGILPSGKPDYEGSTEVFWNDQQTVLHEGKIVYLDDGGRKWTFDQLIPADEWKEPLPTPAELRARYDSKDGWGEHPDHSMSAWRLEVENGDCRAGYWKWVVSQLEQAREDA